MHTDTLKTELTSHLTNKLLKMHVIVLLSCWNRWNMLKSETIAKLHRFHFFILFSCHFIPLCPSVLIITVSEEGGGSVLDSR